MNTLNHKIYQLIQNDILIFEHEIFEVTYHEMLNYIQDNLKNQNKVNYYIKEKINIPNKKYDIISNIIRYDSISLNYCSLRRPIFSYMIILDIFRILDGGAFIKI